MTEGGNGLQIRRGASLATDPTVAVKELAEAIYDPNAALTIFFCSPAFDLDALAKEIRIRFGGEGEGDNLNNVIGCTTAGEISPLGYMHGSLVGVSITGPSCNVAVERIDNLDSGLTLRAGEMLAKRSLEHLELAARASATTTTLPSATNTFAFLLVDGLCKQEELLVSAIYRNLGAIPLFGGSAADGTRFGHTFVYHEGRFHEHSAVLTLLQPDRPIHVFKTEHFVSSSEKMVITKADPANRIVTEINGEPAGREYARIMGLKVDELTPLIFADHPVVVKLGGTTHIRSIQKVNDDGSLSFFCAIDEGIVLTVARANDMVRDLESAFDRARAVVGEPALILGCDCILRSIEADQRGVRERVAEIMRHNNVIGFATYGEQFNAMHMNQTFTGVAIGR